MDAQTHYSVLHVAEDAPQEVIRASYKLLIQKFHPDRVPDDEKSSAGETSKRLNGAYQVLSDPELRAEYDAMLRRVREEPKSTRGENQAPPPPPPPPQPRRTAKKPPAPTASHRPWARYWARTFDLACAVPFLAIAFAIVLPAMDAAGYTASSVTIFLFVVVLPVSVAAFEAVALSTFGTTLGKSLLGIRVALADGNPLSFGAAFIRSIGAQFSGLAWNIPFIGAITAAYWHRKLSSTGTTSWDISAKSVVTHQPVGVLRYGSAIIFCIVMMTAIRLLGEGATSVETQVAGERGTAPENAPATQAASSVVASQTSNASTAADTYLKLGVQQLNDEQFNAGAQRWLDQHPQHANERDIEILQGHLTNVLSSYPQIELRSALDMALQRAYRAGEQRSRSGATPSRSSASNAPMTGAMRRRNEPLPRSLDYSAYAPTESIQPADPYVPIEEPATAGPGLGPRSWEEMKSGAGSNSGR